MFPEFGYFLKKKKKTKKKNIPFKKYVFFFSFSGVHFA